MMSCTQSVKRYLSVQRLSQRHTDDTDETDFHRYLKYYIADYQNKKICVYLLSLCYLCASIKPSDGTQRTVVSAVTFFSKP